MLDKLVKSWLAALAAVAATLLTALIAALYAPLTYPAVATFPSLDSACAKLYFGAYAASVPLAFVSPGSASVTAAFAAIGKIANAAITDIFKSFFILFLLGLFVVLFVRIIS